MTILVQNCALNPTCQLSTLKFTALVCYGWGVKAVFYVQITCQILS